jgi:hypothetical protein
VNFTIQPLYHLEKKLSVAVEWEADGPGARLEFLEKRQIFPCLESTPECPSLLLLLLLLLPLPHLISVLCLICLCNCAVPVCYVIIYVFVFHS